VAGKTLRVEDLDIYGKDLDELPSNPYSRDKVLSSVIHAQGFDGAPAVVSSSRYDDLVASGEIKADLYRGVASGQPGKAQQYREDFAHGPFFVGEGTPANGVYATLDKEFALTGYADNRAEGLLRIGLRKEAKVIPFGDLEAKRVDVIGQGTKGERERAAWREYSAQQKSLMDEIAQATQRQDLAAAQEAEARLYDVARNHQYNHRERVGNDPGRVAALLGYDAIQVDQNVYVILNRTACYVEEVK
jgi:hypothetical protein